MQSDNEFVSPPAAFVACVMARVKSDSGCRAALRRADNPSTASYAWEYLVNYCRLDNVVERSAYALIGASIARGMPEKDGSMNIGAALRYCCLSNSEDDQKAELTRLRRLLACENSMELIGVLGRIVRYLQSRGAPLSYTQLLKDIIYWNEKTRIYWTQSFFHRTAESAENMDVKG